MCLIVERGTKELTAVQDFVVYKSVYADKVDAAKCHAPLFDFTYVRYVRYEQEIKAEDCVRSVSKYNYYDDIARMAYQFKDFPLSMYKKGFHSCKDRDRLNPTEGTIAEFIIPKGAKYVSDVTGLVVSDTIIFKRLTGIPEQWIY